MKITTTTQRGQERIVSHSVSDFRPMWRVRIDTRTDRTTENTLPYMLYDSLPPAYAHLHVTASPFHPVPLVPILCVADEHNIVPLLVSAVSQRTALGLDVPVIGILHSTSGSTVSILVAWRDISISAVGDVSIYAYT